MTATAKELVTQRGEMGFGSGMLVLMAMVWLPALEDLVWVFDTGAVRENPSG